MFGFQGISGVELVIILQNGLNGKAAEQLEKVEL